MFLDIVSLWEGGVSNKHPKVLGKKSLCESSIRDWAVFTRGGWGGGGTSQDMEINQELPSWIRTCYPQIKKRMIFRMRHRLTMENL